MRAAQHAGLRDIVGLPAPDTNFVHLLAAGSSDCLPCAAGTYSEGSATQCTDW